MKILAIVGDYYHDENMCRHVLDATITNIENVSLTYVHESSLVHQLSEKPDLVILFKGNKLHPKDPHSPVWMDEETAIIISKYVKEGGAWFAWHSGLASYEVKTYVDMLQGYFEYHPKLSRITYTADKNNDIINPELEYEIIDEHYFIDCDKENTDVFLYSRSKEGQSIAGWKHLYGDGRVLCFTPAHLTEGLMNSQTVEILIESIKWCLRKN
nr:ThuA domain-containing protein [Bacillus sp. FJAT-50079]